MPNFVLIQRDSFLVCVGIVACNHLIFSLKGVYDKPEGQVSSLNSTQPNTRRAWSIRLSTMRRSIKAQDGGQGLTGSFATRHVRI